MRTGILKELSLLGDALSPEYYEYFTSLIQPSDCHHKKRWCVNIYSAFCLLTKPKYYTAIDILNCDDNFNKHFELFVGFIYQENQSPLGTNYTCLCVFKKIFETIATDKHINFNDLKLNRLEVNDGVQKCINSFNELNIDRNKLNYLNGWQVLSKDGAEFELHLNSIYTTYGVEFTEQVHKALIDYGHTQKKRSLQTYVIYIKAFFEAMVLVCPNHDEIKKCLSRSHVQSFFNDIMNVWFASHLSRGNEPKTFFSYWHKIVKIYTESFIDTGIFDLPIKPFIVPKWKYPKDTAPTFSVGAQATEKEKQRWFVDIPIKINDEEAISIIKSKIDKDLAYIHQICMTKFKEFKERTKRNAIFIKTGNAKPLLGTKNDHKYRGFVGENNLANTVATFYTHGFNPKKFGNYINFLGFQGKNSILLEELNLPTTSSLAVLLTLLVMEHPEITPAWLETWELYDKNGKQAGFKKSNNQYIAVSNKNRKGIITAQQSVVLNDRSKVVVEYLIEHTSFARKQLKASGKAAWRKMLLTASTTEVKHISSINIINNASQYLEWISNPLLVESSSLMTPCNAIELAKLISLRSIRKHRGLQIYLETCSMDAVAEALGHKKKDLVLLASYLPKPLMDFFNDRWIRQFQNAIILEAMKNSPYLLDATDLTAEDIEEFLRNHGLGHLPPHFDCRLQEQTDEKSIKESSFDEISFLISTSLLQLLIAIRAIVENEENKHTFLDIVNDWYESAVFILNSLSTEQYRSDTELASMLHDANQNALDINLIRGAITC
ncbi:hypothetical protein [Aliivibrio fischeri]|uniref:hypothetical protein n=1 Tax=Aliivibrio fischeri TaxID=668 RepID=UPI0012DA1255|nr:hypothetical protein [Aliivibrio fischeri]MUK64391.1 hypothetical protein [Aliivibrio fischeri]